MCRIALFVALFCNAIALHAGTFQAQLFLNLAVPINSADYTITAGNNGDASLFTTQYGNAGVTLAVPATSSYDQDEGVLGIVPVNLLVTAGPVAGFALQYGHSDAASLITSDSFNIENRTKNGVDLQIDFNFGSLVEAQKFTSQEDEYSNARVNFKFADLATGNQFEFFVNGGPLEEEFDDEVRLDPEDPAGTLQSTCAGCVGTVNVHLDASQTVEFAVLASAQGNATWIPEPSTGMLGLAVVGMIVRARDRGVRLRQR
jgi:hypothetical protein